MALMIEKMKAWQKGAIIGFFIAPVWIWMGWLFMSILSLFKIEEFGELFEAMFMLPLIPMIIIQEQSGIDLPFGLTMFLFWAVIGALAGHLIDRKRNK